jgi:hypothetical protein
MIGFIQSFITSSTLANVAQSTAAAVSIETGLKAVGRPGFILVDNDIKPETKKYAATKEFIYQATCLAVYLALVIPIFKYGAFKIAKKHIFKNEAAFKKFKDAKEFLEYHKLAGASKNDRNGSLMKDRWQDKFTPELRETLKNSEHPDEFPIIKGAIELGSTIGSVLGLAVLAPQVSHVVIHPVLRLLGMEDKKKDDRTEAPEVSED